MATDPSYTPYELTHHFKTSQTNFIIAEPDVLDPVLVAAKEFGIQRSNIWIFDNQDGDKIPTGFSSWRTLLDHGERDWIRFDDESISKTTIAAKLFSSGTTGLPKAAALSHYNLIAQQTLVHEVKPLPYEVGSSVKWTRTKRLTRYHASHEGYSTFPCSMQQWCQLLISHP